MLAFAVLAAFSSPKVAEAYTKLVCTDKVTGNTVPCTQGYCRSLGGAYVNWGTGIPAFCAFTVAKVSGGVEAGPGDVKGQWDAVPNATSYTITFYNAKGANVGQISEITATQTEMPAPEDATTFTVRSCRGTRCGAESVQATIAPTAPTTATAQRVPAATPLAIIKSVAGVGQYFKVLGNALRGQAFCPAR